jgi:hypothetical protein
MTSIVIKMRDTLSAHRAERAARHQLECELAAYSTPRERQELEAILERYSPEETRQVRAALAGQAWTAETRARQALAGAETGPQA